jgi:thioredoxin 1
MNAEYATIEPSRYEIDAMQEPVLLEFGTPWCGWCRSAQPFIAQALKDHPDVRHIKVEDGPGQPLGRSFRVKLWPTLVFLKNGQEIARLTRSSDPQSLRKALQQIDPQPAVQPQP